MAPFHLERYLTDLRNRTAWAPECAIEEIDGPLVTRAALHRIAHLWALALLDDRFDTLLLPVLATSVDVLGALESENRERCWGLSRDYFHERLKSRACLLMIDGARDVAERWPGNVWFAGGIANASRYNLCLHVPNCCGFCGL
jgi:hypothetical protein